jgi:osmoprotectant transport system ATP-binding protein
MINRLVQPSSGRILIGGRDTASLPAWELRRSIGYVFQRVGLFPHMTVGENIAVTPRLLGWSRERAQERVGELLALVELDPEMRDRFPETLSGGQQQRVGVARALAAAPRVMLLDEPFGALDPLIRDRLQDSLQRIRRQLALTAVFVTHDVAEALTLGDRIGVMRDGKLLQVGTPAELRGAPADDYVGEFLETPLRQTRRLASLLEGL